MEGNAVEIQDGYAAEVVSDVKELLAKKLALPAGYSLRYSGEDKEQKEAEAFLSKAFGIGVMLMFLVLITQFNSLSRPGIILGSVVMSMIDHVHRRRHGLGDGIRIVRVYTCCHTGCHRCTQRGSLEHRGSL